jgi:hypothetical protein
MLGVRDENPAELLEFVFAERGKQPCKQAFFRFPFFGAGCVSDPAAPPNPPNLVSQEYSRTSIASFRRLE